MQKRVLRSILEVFGYAESKTNVSKLNNGVFHTVLHISKMANKLKNKRALGPCIARLGKGTLSR